MYCFGLSKTFWGLVVRLVRPSNVLALSAKIDALRNSRCLTGVLSRSLGILQSCANVDPAGRWKCRCNKEVYLSRLTHNLTCLIVCSMMAELSDPTNISQVSILNFYSIRTRAHTQSLARYIQSCQLHGLRVAWCVLLASGSYQSLVFIIKLGSVIGGSLSHPVERFPRLFGGNEFLCRYPYFLPCAIVATYTVIAWLIAFFFLEETLKNPTPISAYLGIARHRSRPRFESTASGSPERDDPDKPIPIRVLFTRRSVMVAIGNYVTTALLDIVFRVIQPLFFSTPIALGGLGLPPPAIGYILAAFSILTGLLMFFLFPRIHDAWGSKKTFLVGIACTLPSFVCFPVLSWLAKQEGLSMTVWMLIIMQSAFFLGLNLSFGKLWCTGPAFRWFIMLRYVFNTLRRCVHLQNSGIP